jgi:ABC-type nitrate/sulfonate/bicarbonate transport system substrate-binding protein
LAAGLASCASAAVGSVPGRARAQSLPVLRVGYQPNQYGAQVLYAQDQGFFTKAGLNVEVQQFALGSALAAGVAVNAVDIGNVSVVTIALAHSKNIPFVLVAPGADFHSDRKPPSLLMAGNKSGIYSAKDMNGKTVAAPGLASMGEYGVRNWVDVNGGDSTTLKFVEMPFSQMASAFEAGRVDAASVGEPYLSDVQKVAHSLGATEPAVASHFMVSAWFAMAPWAAAHPDLVARFNVAIRSADLWAAKNPRGCIDIMARTFHQDPAAISPDLLATYPPAITPALIQPTIAVVARYAKFPSFPAAEIIFVAPS